jgi:hypothetical protein
MCNRSQTGANIWNFMVDQWLVRLIMNKPYGAKNPFSFMDLQDVQELAKRLHTWEGKPPNVLRICVARRPEQTPLAKESRHIERQRKMP